MKMSHHKYNAQAVIRDYVDKSLKVLARVCDADLQDFPEDYRMRHNGKDLERGNFEEVLACPENPIQIYKPIEDEFSLEIVPFRGDSFEVTVTAKDTIKMVKIKIFRKQPRFTPPMQKLGLSFTSSTLPDFHTLKVVPITGPGGKLFLTVHGVNYNKVLELEAMRLANPDQKYFRNTEITGGQDWERYGKGVNVVGVCNNPACPSNAGKDQEIILRKGFGAMRITVDVPPTGQKDELRCPLCKDLPPLTPLLIDLGQETEDKTRRVTIKGLLLCFARAAIYIKNGNKVSRKILVSKTPEGEYFGIEPGTEVLQIDAVESWKSPFTCVRCDAKVGYKCNEFKKEKCGHFYHIWCMPVWTGCKICDAKVFLVGKTSDLVKLM